MGIEFVSSTAKMPCVVDVWLALAFQLDLTLAAALRGSATRSFATVTFDRNDIGLHRNCTLWASGS